MSDSTTPQDSAAMSPASAGSVAERPLSDLNPMDDDQLDAIIQGLERIKELEAEVARLRPTDAEANAIRLGEFAYPGLRITDNGKWVDVWGTLRGLLERTK